MSRTGVVLEPRCIAHETPAGILPPGMLPEWATVEPFERPERLSLTIQVLEGSGVLEHVERIAAREATEEELRSVHTPEHVERIMAALRSGELQDVGEFAWVGPGSLEPTLLAVGGLLEAVDAVLGGDVDNAFVFVRPPGHHAETDRAMGYCLFNGNAIAARHAQRVHGLERVAILDWDVHHGNGTEEIFYSDPSVLTVSFHQEGLYPAGRGLVEDRGEGEGRGRNVNIPLPAFTGDGGYLEAWDRIVVPLTRAFAPDLILLGAGQDASASDPLGRMAVTAPGYRALADRAVELAGELCGGRLVAFMEGGYSLQHLPLANLAILEGLAGLPGTFETDWVGCDTPATVTDVVRAAIDEVERANADSLAS